MWQGIRVDIAASLLCVITTSNRVLNVREITKACKSFSKAQGKKLSDECGPQYHSFYSCGDVTPDCGEDLALPGTAPPSISTVETTTSCGVRTEEGILLPAMDLGIHLQGSLNNDVCSD